MKVVRYATAMMNPQGQEDPYARVGEFVNVVGSPFTQAIVGGINRRSNSWPGQ